MFRVVLGVDYNITNDEKDFISSSYFRINYSTTNIDQADIQIVPYGLLEEISIVNHSIVIHQWKGLPSFFTNSQSEISFDMLSAAFYLVSRYEEYLPYEPDLYQRFPVNKSISYQHDFLHLPIVDLWALELKKVILLKNSSVLFPEKKMTFIPTYDIDIAYSYLGKGVLRNLGGSARDLLSGKTKLINERLNVLRLKQEDPFDSFSYLDTLHERFHLKPIYFFLLSQGGEFDKNISPSNPHMISLIKRIEGRYETGIHPSYQSNEDKEILKEEIGLLQSKKSRQHYIRFELPATYQNLIELGITEDYSMGYGSMNGFRAGTSYPHVWFDLEQNKSTDLLLFPFCYMECNSFFEQKYSAEEAYTEMIHYLEIVKLTRGHLIPIWHNFSLGSDPMWKGWKEVYERFLKKIESSV